MGPGQDQLKLDAAADHVRAAEKAAADEDYAGRGRPLRGGAQGAAGRADRRGPQDPAGEGQGPDARQASCPTPTPTSRRWWTSWPPTRPPTRSCWPTPARRWPTPVLHDLADAARRAEPGRVGAGDRGRPADVQAARRAGREGRRRGRGEEAPRGPGGGRSGWPGWTWASCRGCPCRRSERAASSRRPVGLPKAGKKKPEKQDVRSAGGAPPLDDTRTLNRVAVRPQAGRGDAGGVTR